MMWNLQRYPTTVPFWMKECDILGESKHTLTPPTYFQGVKTAQPQDLRPCQNVGVTEPTTQTGRVRPCWLMTLFRRVNTWSSLSLQLQLQADGHQSINQSINQSVNQLVSQSVYLFKRMWYMCRWKTRAGRWGLPTFCRRSKKRRIRTKVCRLSLWIPVAVGLPNYVVLVFSRLIGLLGRPIIQLWTASREMTKSIAPRFAHIARGWNFFSWNPYIFMRAFRQYWPVNIRVVLTGGAV